ncbi:multidrug efflux transporter transcriptional repressor AcrR [Uliginosibacterium flavum]|uniref:TetR family transcriptional regulator n=1 Tax=Uliginosibacterium flavum TaxID=1396831 RepID=A0ABV2TR14_9RHOO
MARKTKEEALATRGQLLDAAARLFCEQGVSSTSLHEIAEAAGLTRGAVYWHFDNKGDLLMALWERVALPMQQAFDEVAREQANNPLQRIRSKACWIAEHIEHDEPIRRLMTIMMLRCEFTQELESTREHFLRVREDCLTQMRSEIQLAMDVGQLTPTLSVEQIAIGLFGLVDGLCFHWLISPTRFQIANVTRLSVEAYLAGLNGKA